MRKRVSRAKQQVFSVTDLPGSLRDDQSGRMRRYLWSMGIRTACFVLAVVAVVVLRWTMVGLGLVIAAVILPYVAVVAANATRPRAGTAPGPMTPDDGAAPQISPRRPDEDSGEHGPVQT